MKFNSIGRLFDCFFSNFKDSKSTLNMIMMDDVSFEKLNF